MKRSTLLRHSLLGIAVASALLATRWAAATDEPAVSAQALDLPALTATADDPLLGLVLGMGLLGGSAWALRKNKRKDR